MTPRGFLADEGVTRSLAIVATVATQPANIRVMAWLMHRMAKAIPHLGYIVIVGGRPR
jgi:hypothetical protein